MITLNLQLHGSRFSQFQGFEFNSMVRFGDKFLGANESGLATIGGSTDNGAAIQAEIELPPHDFGVMNKKRVRFVYLGYEADGDIDINLTFDQNAATTITRRLTPLEGSGQQQGNREYFSRSAQGRYVTVNIRNVAGSFFGLNSIEVLPIILSAGLTR